MRQIKKKNKKPRNLKFVVKIFIHYTDSTGFRDVFFYRIDFPGNNFFVKSTDRATAPQRTIKLDRISTRIRTTKYIARGRPFF